MSRALSSVNSVAHETASVVSQDTKETLAWLHLYVPVFEICFIYISLAIGVKKYLEALRSGGNNNQPH
jgi:hypothetical protein